VGVLAVVSVGDASAATETTIRVSVSSSGAEADGHTFGVVISDDGGYIAFQSFATNLVADDTNGVSDVFWRDLANGITKRVSVSTGGVEGNAASDGPSISPDGRYVAFMSDATNLVSSDQNGVRDVFLHDTSTGTTSRVSVANDGAEANGPGWSGPDVSANGQYVAFVSSASNLVSDDTNTCDTYTTPGTCPDMFIRDTVNNLTTRIMGLNGEEPNGRASFRPSITPDGAYVLFTSDASNLVANDGEDIWPGDVFVYDTVTGANEMISVQTDGTRCLWPDSADDISDDGRYAVWTSDCVMDPSVTGFVVDQIYLRDRQAGTTILASRPDDGSDPAGGSWPHPLSFGASISGDGRYVTFTSWASNMVAGDTNTCAGHAEPGTCPDVFIRDLQAETTVRVSVGDNGQEANDESRSVPDAIGGDGGLVIFSSGATNLVATDLNGMFDAFLRGDCADLGTLPGQPDFDGDGIGDSCDLDEDDDGYTNAQEELKGSDTRDGSSTPEACDALDNDLDGSTDEAPTGGDWDTDGDTIKDCLDPDVDTDGDTLFNPNDVDDDDDGYSDSLEHFIATDSLDGCPNNPSHDAWPPDLNIDGTVNLMDSVLLKDAFGSNGTTIPKSPNYDRRTDLNGDGIVNILDALAMKPYFGTSCA
jgi:Tol biopolymer transport system component